MRRGCRPPATPSSPPSRTGWPPITGYPTVIKADGLAAGKGVVIATDEAEARAALEAMLVERRFGEHPVVVEEFLDGDELSVLALCDGETALPLAPARDYKRIGDGDTGPNTGGMGAFSPVPEVDDAFVERVRAEVHQPVLDELARRGTAVPRRALRRADADGGRAEGARVQRPLRRSRDAGRAPAPAQRPARPARPRHPARRPRRRRAGVGCAGGGHRRARLARLPGVLLLGRRHHRPRPGARRASRSPTRAPRSATARS